ncbi:hypothetical protein PJ985_04155 [Streptomyces sp. ACA25]|uniref:hypothetical protein n=1 Tax=Streptomyces sp. ACA25 TaxID=3022596 RepID=UPI00230796F2|nr:hypothetical protein [Streptomyces sp. ACA25]MDB1086758.1 hypothetical protein [Streptomyces sp. ACA25]
MTHLARQFLVAGTQLATASLLTGLVGLLLFIPLTDHTTAVSAYGTALMAMSVLTLLASGATVWVVQRLSGRPGSAPSPGTGKRSGSPPESDAAETALADICAVVLAGMAALVPLLLVVGTAIALTDGGGLGTVAYWARVPGMLFVPMSAVLSGLLVLEGRQRVQLRIAGENLLLVTVAAVTLSRFSLSPEAVLIAVGLIGVALDGFTFFRLWLRLGTSRTRLRTALRAGRRQLCTAPRVHLRRLPSLAAGTMDGLVMMSSFLVIVLAANQVSAATAAVTAMLVNVARTLIVPLKQFGIVGGRLARSAEAPEGTEQRLRLYTTCVTLLLAPFAVVLLLFPSVVSGLAGGAFAHPDAETVIRLLGAQLLFEGITGFGASALKILLSPGASLPYLAAVMYGLVVPLILALAVTGHLTLILLWTVMLGGRIAFAAAVVRLWLRRREPEREALSPPV